MESCGGVSAREVDAFSRFPEFPITHLVTFQLHVAAARVE